MEKGIRTFAERLADAERALDALRGDLASARAADREHNEKLIKEQIAESFGA